MGAAAADLFRGRGGRQRESGELDQSADGGAHLGVAQGLGEGAGVLAAFPHQLGHRVEGLVQVALDAQVAGDPGAGHAQFAGFPQESAQGAAIAYDQRRCIGRPCLGTVPGADAHRDRGSQQLFEEGFEPQRGISHGAHLRDADPGIVHHYVNTGQARSQSCLSITSRQNRCSGHGGDTCSTPKGPPAPRMADGPFGLAGTTGTAGATGATGQR